MISLLSALRRGISGVSYWQQTLYLSIYYYEEEISTSPRVAVVGVLDVDGKKERFHAESTQNRSYRCPNKQNPNGLLS